MLIVRDIIHYASARKLEWIMAGMMLHLGYILALPANTFELSSSFVILKMYLSESGWALVFGAFGFARLIILILNGGHLKYSAELRMLMAACSFVIIAMWVWGIDASNTASTGGATYKWLALGELMNVWQASADRLARKAMKHGRY